jgi:hypothetical protein
MALRPYDFNIRGCYDDFFSLKEIIKFWLRDMGFDGTKIYAHLKLGFYF